MFILAKKLLLISVTLFLSVISMYAQRIQVVDNDNIPIPFVAVTTAEGKLIASTDIDGWFDNTGGHAVLHLSQVAYKPMTIAVADIKDSRIVLEDAAYDLPEVMVKPKDLLYCQTYFRLIYIDDDGPVYYRSGVIDNTYNFAKKEVKSKMGHISKAEYGLIRFVVDRLAGKFDHFSRLPEVSYYKKLLRMRDEGMITITDVGDGRKVIADSVSNLGYIEWNPQERIRTVSFDIFRYNKHQKEAKKHSKAEKKGKTYEMDTTVAVNGTIYQVYRTDSVGNSRVDDFVMSQYTQEGVHRHQGTNYIIQIQSFASDYAYVDKKEYNQLRKDNKVEMNFESLNQFEKNKNIPPLAPNYKKQIDKLFVKKEDKQ